MTYSIASLIALLTAFQLLFVAIYLLIKRENAKRGNVLLGITFLLFAISLLDFTIRISGIMFSWPTLHLVDDGFFFLYGPLLYLYVKRVVYTDFTFRPIQIFHFIPFLLYCIYLVTISVEYSLPEQSAYASKIITADLPGWVFLAGVLIYVYLFAYIWMAFRVLQSYRAVIKNKFASIDKINLNWIGFMINSFAIITLFAMLHNVIPAFTNEYIHLGTLAALLIFTFYFINRVLLKALNQPLLFSGIRMEESEKYSGSGLQSEEVSKYAKELEVLIAKEHVYRNSNLSIIDLSEKMDIPGKVLSQVINQYFKQNFFDFINTYRCNEVKHLLKQSGSSYTILEAMYEAGFNSKSSFNKEFKKLTGQTPTEYRKSIQN